MKYIVKRTSIYRFNEQDAPVEGAKIEYVHEYDIRTDIITQKGRENIWEQFVKHNRDIIQLNNGYWRGTNKDAEPVWVVEIGDLHSFVDENGNCILSKTNCEEGYYEIEIYDDYRE